MLDHVMNGVLWATLQTAIQARVLADETSEPSLACFSWSASHNLPAAGGGH